MGRAALAALVAVSWWSPGAPEPEGAELALRRMCPNKLYRVWSHRYYGLLYDGDPDVRVVAPHVEDLFGGKRMLEIGGPTPGTNVYEALAAVDNVVQKNHVAYFSGFSDATERGDDDSRAYAAAVGEFPTDADVDGAPYAPRGAVLGRVIQRHGARLDVVGDATYDVVMSSHSLEHFFDPLEALKEWDRVLAPGGLLLLVLPSVGNCTDRWMRPVTMQDLLSIRTAATEYDAGDWDRLRRHYFENYVRLFADRDDFDPWGLAAMDGADERRARIREAAARVENMIHWHAWDFDVMREAVEGCLGYDLLLLQLQAPLGGVQCPFHQVLIARKPAPATAEAPP